MKLFANKKLIQKITIVMVFLILFNFIMPNYSRAGIADTIAEGAETIGEALAPIINVCARFIGDSILTVLQKMFIGTDPFENEEIKIALSPGKIFSGLIYTLDADFISNKTIDTSKNNEESPDTSINTTDITNEKWYKRFEKARDDISKKFSDAQGDSWGGTDADKMYAYMMARNLTNFNTPEEAINLMENWCNKLTTSFDKQKFYDEFEPDEGYDESYNEDKVKENIEDILDKSGLIKAAEEYCKYKSESSDNDPSLYYASKPENAPAYILHDIISTWYKIMRNIAIVFLLSILVYIGIRILLSSTASDNTKYKKMLMDWVIALCILFVLHYIMAFTINITQFIVDAFTGKGVTTTSVDEIMYAVREKASYNNTTGLGYTILYLVLIFYIIYFIYYYVKRVVYVAFLTLIAPLVSITYPLDKMGDSKAQAFDMWIREYMMTIIVQPIHLLIYTTMISSALSLATNNPIYAIVVIGAMIPAEKFIKEMFGLDSKKGPKGGLASAALMMGGMQKLAHRKPPEFGHHPGGNEKGSSDSSKEKIKKPRMDGERTAELSKSITGGKDEDKRNIKTNNPDTKTEDKPDIDDGDFQDSRSINSGSKMDEKDSPSEDNINKELSGERPYSGSGIDEKESPSEDNVNKQLLGEKPYSGSGMDEKESPSEDNINKQLSGRQPYSGLGEDEIGIQSDDEKNKQPLSIGQQYSGSGKAEVEPPVKAPNKDDIRLEPNIPSRAKEKKSNKKNIKGPKKKSIVGSALKATAGHYVRNINIRKLARKATRGALGVVTAGTAATIGLAAGIATGDPSNAVKYMAAGGVAGNALGRNVGDGIANFAGGAVDLGTGIRDTYRQQRDEIISNDKEAQKAQLEKENKKYLKKHSAEINSAIKNRYGNINKGDMEKTQEAILRYRNNGVEDLDTIFNAYNLEQGKDFYGEDIGTKLSQEHAMYIAQMASKMDDSPSSRKAVENAMQMQFAQNYEDNGMDSTKAMEQAKADRKREMQYIDMAKGKSRKEASIAAKQAEINKKYEDRKEEKAARQQAKFNAEAQRSANITTTDTTTTNTTNNGKKVTLTRKPKK